MSMGRVAALAAAAGLGLGLGLGQGLGGQPAAAQEQFLVIGTGGVTGVYYPTGGAIQRLVNAGRDEHGVRVSVESTGGSVFNLNALESGDIDMGVVQSDWQYHAYYGTHENFPEANEDLRAVFSIHSEPFQVVARADAGIETFEDLQGERVNISNPGAGARATMEVVMNAYGWTTDVFSQTSELAAAEQSQALCDNNVDAIVFVVGIPSGTIQEATTSCDSVLVDVAGEPIRQLIEENPYYAEATIPGGLYRGNPEPTETFGVKATLVTSADTDEEAVYQVVRAVFENFDDFRRLHPAFTNLEKEDMVEEGLSAPLHDGARRYYEEAGLL